MDNTNKHINPDKNSPNPIDEYQDISPESLEKTEDEDLLQAYKDLRLLAAASRTEKEGINIEKRLNEFKYKQARKKRLHIYKLGFAIVGIAAAALIVFLWNNPYYTSTQQTKEGVTVFLSDTVTPKHIILQTEKTVSSGKKTPQHSTSPPQGWNASQPNVLDYHNSQKLTAKANELPEKHSLTVPRGQTFKLILSDGTEVYMNADSRLIYPSKFTGKERNVYLDGEAYFQVAKDSAHPFIVNTHTLQTRVLGTEFNISSYKDSQTQITLISGSIEVRDPQKKRSARMIPGEQACLETDGNFGIQKVDVSSYVHWKEGYFYYDNVSLLDIMKDIGRWYNVSVVFNNAEAMDYKLHFVADRKQDLQHALTLLNRMNKFNITLKKDNRIYVE